MQGSDHGTPNRAKAEQIKMLAREFPGLRIAYVDQKKVKDKGDEFFSVLSKNAGDGTDNMVEEYRVKVINRIRLFWRWYLCFSLASFLLLFAGFIYSCFCCWLLFLPPPLRLLSL